MPLPPPDSFADQSRLAYEKRDFVALKNLALSIAPAAADPLYSDAVKLICARAAFDPAIFSAVNALLVDARTCVPSPYLYRISELADATRAGKGYLPLLATMRELASTLWNAIECLPVEEGRKRNFTSRLVWVLTELQDEAGAKRLLQHLELLSTDPDNDTEVCKISWYLFAWPHLRDSLKVLLALLHERRPDSRDVFVCYCKSLTYFSNALDPFLDQLFLLHQADPEDNACSRLLGHELFMRGDWTRTKIVYETLSQRQPHPDIDYRLGVTALKLGFAEEARSYFRKMPEPTSSATLGSLAPVCSHVVQAMNSRYLLSEKINIRLLDECLGASCKTLQAFLIQNATSFVEAYQAAQEIVKAIDYPFWSVGRLREASGFQFRDDYGAYDIDAYRTVWKALGEHVAILTKHCLSPSTLASPVSSVRAVMRCAEMLTSTMAALGRPHEAREFIAPLAIEADDVFYRRLNEFCMLNEGSFSELQSILATEPDRQIDICRSLPFDEWNLHESAPRELLIEEDEFQAHFEGARENTPLQVFKYDFPGLNLYAATAKNVTVRDSELVISSQNTVVLPSSWHWMRGYPRQSDCALSVGSQGCLLKRPLLRRNIEEPVLILANNDCLRVANYFHWIILILTRVSLLINSGDLDKRKLLMPAEARSWMRESLQLSGIRDDQLILYSCEEDVVTTDAKIIMPIEFAGPKLLRSLREKMLKSAHVDLDPRSACERPAYYLARSGTSRRAYFDEDLIEKMATELGYICLAPETLSVSEQVRVFANAGAIAGPEGAAYANLVFCRDDIRIAQIVKEDIQMSVFPDIALALGQQFRWLYGKTDESCQFYKEVINSPGRIDLSLVKDGLLWARGLNW